MRGTTITDWVGAAVRDEGFPGLASESGPRATPDPNVPPVAVAAAVVVVVVVVSSLVMEARLFPRTRTAPVCTSEPDEPAAAEPTDTAAEPTEAIASPGA
jgi:hypothetical protein